MGLHPPSAIGRGKEWKPVDSPKGDNRSTSSGKIKESERLHGSREGRGQDNGRIEDAGFRPTQPSGGKEQEKPPWLLHLGPINLTRCRFKGQTYGRPYKTLRGEGSDGESRYIASLQGLEKKKGALSDELSVFLEY